MIATTNGTELPPSKYLCLTILGYRKPGMSEDAYRRHMTKVSAPMTKDLMVKYGVKRWTVVCFVKDVGYIAMEVEVHFRYTTPSRPVY